VTPSPTFGTSQIGVIVVLVVFIVVLLAAIGVMVRFIMVWRNHRSLLENDGNKYGETRIDAPSFKNPYAVN